ncbi:hypothetical protein Tco_0435605 [Tanacetum coccineum]
MITCGYPWPELEGKRFAPSGNDLVFEVNNDGVTGDGIAGDDDGVDSKSKSDFGTHNPNHIDAGLDYNMHSNSKSDYSYTSVDYLSDGEEERLYHMGDSETIIEHKKTKVEKYPMHDIDTHWQMKKPKIGKTYVDAEQPKECLTYYALANGFQLWFYRSATNKLIAMCGQGLEVQKDP